MKTKHVLQTAAAFLAALAFAAPLAAQPANNGGPRRRPMPPPVVSPEISEDRQITFRLFAPLAENVKLNGGDFASLSALPRFNKSTNGLWEAMLGPVDPGAYRYTFDVDGAPMVDPRNPASSESLNNVWSLAVVSGSELFDTRAVPHGAVAAVTYESQALGRMRRMHVYTPPGYEKGNEKYPTFYLLHGAGDSDDAWTSVGRAGFILDNLIAAKKARPMIVVMPAGHTQSMSGPLAGGVSNRPTGNEFSADFLTAIMPYIEKNYRVLTTRSGRAIAGLSMGGSQTLNIAFPHLDQFAYIGVFSSGLLGPRTRPGDPAPRSFGEAWEAQNAVTLDNKGLKSGLRLIWFGVGKEDFLAPTSQSTVELLRKHGFKVVSVESSGGHTWINWRNYLAEFAPQLFR